MDLQGPGANFERLKNRIGLYGGPLFAVAAGLLAEDSASPTLVGIMVLCVTWWLTEALPPAVVSLGAAVAVVLTGLAPAKEVFAAFGTPLLFLFVGSFFIAEAMQVHGLAERIGEWVARRARGRFSFFIAIGLTAFVLSMLMSNSAATVIVLPIALGTAGPDRRDRYGTALALVVAWGASVGGLGTPVGTPPNALGIAELAQRGIDMGFLEWMAIGVPMGLVMMAGLFGLLSVVFGIRPGQPLPPRVHAERRPWCQGERAVLIAFGIAIAGWLAPSVLALAAPDHAITKWVDVRLTEEVVALIAGCSLFVLPGAKAGEPERPALL